MSKRLLILGAGHQGLSMSAHLALNGMEVSLWNRSPENISTISKTREIHCSGIVNGTAKLKMVTSDIKEAISDTIMVTTPSTAHKDIARTIAPFIHKETVIILNPGRTFGAIEFAKTLTECGVKELPHIAETQTIVYTCRKKSNDSVSIYALKDEVFISSIARNDINFIIEKIPQCIRNHFKPTDSFLKTSLMNVGMVLHCAPVMMNIGWIETERVDFKYYYDGISQSVAGFIEKIDAERIAVANAAGCSVETVAEWLKRTYHVEGDSLFECIRNNESYREIDAPPTLRCRYILEDVQNGLVPIEYLGYDLGVKTPNITTVINLAESVLNMKFRENGRRFKMSELECYAIK